MTAMTIPARAPFPIAFTASTEGFSVNENNGRQSEVLTNQKSDKCRSQWEFFHPRNTTVATERGKFSSRFLLNIVIRTERWLSQ